MHRREKLLADVIHRLQGEVEGLREAMAHRSVIEQAKGIVAERTGCDIDTAFEQMQAMSQRLNVKLARVAAAVVATRQAEPVVGVPDGEEQNPQRTARRDVNGASGGNGHALAGAGAGAGTGERRRRPRPKVEPSSELMTSLLSLPDAKIAADLELLTGHLTSATTLDQLLSATLADCTWPSEPDRAVLLRVASDQGLEIVSARGLDEQMAAQWRRIPPHVDFPATVAARYRVAVFCDDPVATRERFPVFAERDVAPFCNLPLLHDGHVFGVLGLGWPFGTEFTEDARRHLGALATLVGKHWHRLSAATEQPEDHRSGAAGAAGPPLLSLPSESEAIAVSLALSGVLEPALLLTPLFDPPAPGAPEDEMPVIRDFRVDWANAAAARKMDRPQEEMATRTLLQLLPYVALTRCWTAAVHAARDHRSVTVNEVELVLPGGLASQYNVRATPLWSGVLLCLLPLRGPSGTATLS